MASSADYASNMVAALALTEPTLDTSIGSITRKIIDAVAGSLAENSNDLHLINYTYDIDSKTGADLDDFVALFGMKRIVGGRATAIVTFARTASVAKSQVSIVPIGAQVVSATNPSMSFQVIMSATLGLNVLTVDLPVQAINAGPTANVAAATLIKLGTGIPGIQTVNNTQPATGGTNSETDDQLRARFKATALRNLAGTENMYKAMALQTPADPTDPTSIACTAANVLGARLSWQEQVAIVQGGTASSSIPDAAYIYPGSVFFGPAITGGQIFSQGANQQYTVAIDNTITYPPSPDHSKATLKITSLTVPDGVYDLQFDYLSKYSRNDPLGTRWSGGGYISNRVDLWCNGIIARQFTQTCTFTTDPSLTFMTDPQHRAEMDYARFTLPNGTHPASGDYFMPLVAGPVLDIPNTLGPSGVYKEGIHYDLVHQSDAFGYSPVSKFGICWHLRNPQNTTQVNTLPPTTGAGSIFTFTYSYNIVPMSIQNAIEAQWRLVGTDARVHGGMVKYYRFHLAVVFLPNNSPSSVSDDISTALRNLIGTLGFRSAMQVSDVLQAVHNVPGVDNVRFLTQTDPEALNSSYVSTAQPYAYGMQQVYSDGTLGPVSQIGGRAADVYFDDASYPMFESVRIITKARNTFGVS